ncbi:recombinase family protein [bacterium]|jgi:site-specific DNA recombinase|nr:recombinase family protein [bacterium]MBT5014838.1 recombinase family protein [bacterium]
MKAILIARVSTEEQKEAGNSLPAQIARLEAYCKNKGFPIMEICSFDESAYYNDRTEFDRIIDFILSQTDKIAICCDKVDRITRNIFDTRISTLYEKALKGELELHFVSDGQVINSTISAVEKFQFSINLGLAKYYSDAISDNVKRAQEQKLRKGEWLAKAPFGYKNIKKDDGATDVIVEEYQAQIIKKTFELYATGTFSMDLLLKKLKIEHNVSWPKGTLGKILNNPFYYGVMLVKGKKYSHRYPPLISLDLFNKVQQVKEVFNKKPVKYAGKAYVYRGLLRCGHCDLSITPEQHKGYIYYHCTQYKGKHNAKWLREETITKQLGQVFKKMTIPTKIVDEIVENLNTLQQDKVDFYQRDLDKFTKEQKSLTKMLDNLYLDKLKGSITESDYDKFYQSLHDQLITINSRLEQLEESDDNYFTTAKYVLSLANKAQELFESSEVDERRQLINLLLSNVRVEDEYVLYDVQKPFDLIVNCSDGQLWRG